MSVLIVSPNTMDRWLNGLDYYRRRGMGVPLPAELDPLRDPAIQSQIPTAGADGLESRLTLLGRMLYALNGQAWQIRYGKEPTIPDYTFIRQAVSPLSAIKAGMCLEYQCAEGELPNDPRFQWLQRSLDRLCRFYVVAQPEYDAAPWDD